MDLAAQYRHKRPHVNSEPWTALGYARFVNCSGCGKALDVAGIFPGGKVRCECGLEARVPAAGHAGGGPSGQPTSTSAYRESSERPLEAGMITCPFCGGPCSADSRACPHCNVELASVRCPSCFALHFSGSQFCARCGKELQLEALLDATDAPCPRCDKPLSVAGGERAEGLEITAMLHECLGCGGIFLDNKSLEAIVAKQGHAPHQAAGVAHVAPAASRHALDPVHYVKCPLCRAIMNRVNFGKRSGVIVDVCKAHGTWFDAGELTRAIEFVARGGLDETKRRDEEDKRRLEHDPAVARAAAEMRAELVRESVEEGRAVGWWSGRASGSWGSNHSTLLDVLLELLR